MRRHLMVVGFATLAVASGLALAHPGGPWGASESGPGYGCGMHANGGMGMAGPGHGMMHGGWGYAPAENLDLTAEQREKLAAARAEQFKKMESVRAEARKSIDAILTPEQRSRLGSCGTVANR